MGDGESGTPRYRAFISYSHRDASIGRWLHRRLEGYRLPRRLAGSEGERGPVPARLTPIFRDREELPAAGDLSERVRAALADSGALIVVCSPHAAASPWVAKEIATFRALHPDRPVLAAIVEGEPAECFSPALTANGRVEPLAADFRPGRDGRRLAVLKLVAALAGVGLDALVQRDAQRRVRSVTYVTAAALAAVLIMAVLTAFALNQRHEAERQRAEAEGLVEFMLTDLRDRLREVGRIDIMVAVNHRALGWYRQQNLSHLAADSLERRARILHSMAEDDEKLGHLDAMMGDAVEASRTTIALLTDQPNNRSRLYLNAQSEYWIGRAHELRSEWESAADRYAAYSNAARTLIRLEPSNPVFLAEMGYSLVNLGQIQMDGLKDSQAAMGSFAEGAEWLEKARATRPRDKHLLLELANAYGWIADSHYDRKAWSTSVDWRLRQYSLLRLLAESSSSSGDQQLAFRLATVHRALASSYFQLRKPELVRRHFDVALVLFEMLSRHDPANMEWLLPKAFLECEAVFHHYAAPAGRSEAALRSALHEDVIRLDPDRHPAAKPAARCEKALPDRPERRRRHDAI